LDRGAFQNERPARTILECGGSAAAFPEEGRAKKVGEREALVKIKECLDFPGD
jgi:hypothetical protein